jgi:hypothetical protein
MSMAKNKKGLFKPSKNFDVFENALNKAKYPVRGSTSKMQEAYWRLNLKNVQF